MNEKYIFLDIDGVLCTDDCSKKEYHPDYLYPFHKACIANFNSLLLKTDAKIVLSSDWRKLHDGDLIFLDDLFKYNGVIKSPIGCTLQLANNRDLEIDTYIKSEAITNFLILDDMALTIYPDRFIRTDINEGFAANNAILEKSIKILLG